MLSFGVLWLLILFGIHLRNSKIIMTKVLVLFIWPWMYMYTYQLAESIIRRNVSFHYFTFAHFITFWCSKYPQWIPWIWYTFLSNQYSSLTIWRSISVINQNYFEKKITCIGPYHYQISIFSEDINTYPSRLRFFWIHRLNTDHVSKILKCTVAWI